MLCSFNESHSTFILGDPVLFIDFLVSNLPTYDMW